MRVSQQVANGQNNNNKHNYYWSGDRLRDFIPNENNVSGAHGLVVSSLSTLVLVSLTATR